MRSMNARSLNGGVTRMAMAYPRNAPKRPSDSTMRRVQAPRVSNGRRTIGSRSVMRQAAAARDPRRSGIAAAIHSECPEGEVLRVQVVLQEEHPRKARAVPERILP